MTSWARTAKFGNPICGLIIAIFLGIFAPRSSFAQTGKLVGWTSGDSGSTSLSTTYLLNIKPGNLLLIFSHWGNQKLTASVSDSFENKFIPISGPISLGTSGRAQAWYAKNVKGGHVDGITVKYSGTTTSISLVDGMEYSGLDTIAPLDVFAATAGTGKFQDTGPSPATTASDEIIVGMFGYGAYASPYTAGPGFKFEDYDATSFLEDMSVTATASYSAKSTSQTPVSWAGYVIAFRKMRSGLSSDRSLSRNALLPLSFDSARQPRRVIEAGLLRAKSREFNLMSMVATRGSCES